MDIHIRLKELRNRLNLTQKEMADKLEIALRAYQTYEQGSRSIPDEIKISMTQFDVSLHWLLTGQGEMFIGKVAQEEPVVHSPSFCRDCAKLEAKLELVTEERDGLKQKCEELTRESGRLEGQIEVLKVEIVGLVAKQNRFNAG